jgi:hypothetical protein
LNRSAGHGHIATSSTDVTAMASKLESEDRTRQLWPPLISIVYIIGISWYVSADGLASLSPLHAFGLIATVSLVLTYLVRLRRQRFDNALTAAIEGVSSFISMAAGIVFLSLVLHERGLDKQLGHIDALLRSPTMSDAFWNLGPVVTVSVFVITIVALVVTITILVYTDIFGRNRSKPS